MVYIAVIEDSHALIFDGPVVYDQVDASVLTSSNLTDVKDSWEFKLLADKEAEWPVLRQNALFALQRIEQQSSNQHTSNQDCNGAASERHILDFGSGWGFFLAAAKELGWHACGLEPLPASAVYARARFGLNIITDTLRPNLLPANAFDVITAFQVFEHLPYPARDIQHLYAALRPGGLILIEVPNFATWTMALLQAKHRHFVQDHLNFFSAQTLGQLMTNNNFTVVDHYYPLRRMSVRHIVKHWLPLGSSARITNVVQNLLQKSSLWERTIGVNLGDIVAVIGRKPLSLP